MIAVYRGAEQHADRLRRRPVDDDGAGHARHLPGPGRRVRDRARCRARELQRDRVASRPDPAPPPDRDRDGVVDGLDKCPTRAGPPVTRTATAASIPTRIRTRTASRSAATSARRRTRRPRPQPRRCLDSCRSGASAATRSQGHADRQRRPLPLLPRGGAAGREDHDPLRSPLQVHAQGASAAARSPRSRRPSRSGSSPALVPGRPEDPHVRDAEGPDRHLRPVRGQARRPQEDQALPAPRLHEATKAMPIAGAAIAGVLVLGGLGLGGGYAVAAMGGDDDGGRSRR